MYFPRIAAVALAAACLVLCQPAAFAGGGQQPIYVEDFKADTGQLSQRKAEKVENNAAALSEALVHELNARGIAALRLGGQDPAPRAGLVISGVFSENVPSGILSQFSAKGSSAPNTEVRLSIVDLDGAPGRPASVISVAASLGGQGSMFSLNPYELAAKAVVHHIASGRSIDDLAKRIADQVLMQRA